MMENQHVGKQGLGGERRSLRRLPLYRPVRAALESANGRRVLGSSEVADFSGLGMALRGADGLRGVPPGERLWVTLIAAQGIIPLRARLVHRSKGGDVGLVIEMPGESAQNFLLRLYERAARTARLLV